MNIGRIRDARRGQAAPHGGGDFLDLCHGTDLLRQDVTRDLDAECEPAARRTGCIALGPRENGRMGRQHAFASARPYEGDAPPDLLRRAAEMTGEQQLVGQGGEAAREIVGAAVALRLADQAHDSPGIDRSGFDQRRGRPREPRAAEMTRALLYWG